MGKGEIVPFVNRSFERGVVITTVLSVFEYCASPLCPFDLLPSPKIEGNQCGANSPQAKYPYPAAPAACLRREVSAPRAFGQPAALLLRGSQPPSQPPDAHREKQTHRALHRAIVFGLCFTHFWQIFRVAGMRWPKGLAYNNGGPHSTSSPMSWWL